MKSVILAVYIIFSTGAAFFFYFRGLDHQRSKLVTADTVYVPYAIHDTLKVSVYRIRGNKDPAAEAEISAKGIAGPEECSVSVPSGKADYSFIARADTAYQDSLLSLRLGFLSPLPIHPDSRFVIDISYRKMQVTRQTEFSQTSKHSGKLHFSLSLGLGIGLLHKQADIFAGAGISYSF